MLLKKGIYLFFLAGFLIGTMPAFATTVTTGGIIDPQPTSVTVTGTIGTGYDGIPEVRFHFSPDPDFSSGLVISNNLFEAGEVFYELSQAGFATQSRYYYKLVVTDDSDTYAGHVESFWTLATQGSRIIDGITSFVSDFDQIQLVAMSDLNLPGPNESYVAFAVPFGAAFDIQNAVSPVDQGYITGDIDEDIGSISVTFSGLVEGMRYDIKLGNARWNGTNPETYNYNTQIHSSRYTLAPEATGNVLDIGATSSTNSITLTWDASDLEDWVGVRVFRGAHTPPGNGGGPIFGTSFFVSSGASQTATFSSLPAATFHDFTFYALNQTDGQTHTNSYVEVGAINNVSTLSVLPDGPASNLALTGDALSANQLSLDWAEPLANVVGYLVLQNEGGLPADTSVVQNGQAPPPEAEVVSSPHVVLSDLNAGTLYSVTVIPFNRAGNNHTSAHYRTGDAISASFYTLATQPAPVDTLTPINSDSESIQLAWDMPAHAKGGLLYYQSGTAELPPVPVDNGVAPPETDLSGPVKVVNLGDVDSYEVTGLEPITDYSFAIVPYNYASDGDAITATYHYNFDDPATLVTSTQTAVLTVAADQGQQKVHGEADPTLTYTATGFVGTDDESILTGSLAREAGEGPGTYAITLGDLDAGDTYSIEFTGADFTIRPNYGPDPDNRLHVDRAVIGGNQSGDSWTNAIPELADALKWAAQNEADWSSDGALKVYVAAGVYTPLYSADPETFGVDMGRGNSFALVNNVEIYGGFAPANGMTAMSSRDPDIAITVLSGDIDGNDDSDENGIVTDPDQINGENSFRVVTASGVDGSAVLDGFFITAGLANADAAHSPDQTYGAGMYLHGGEPVLANLVFTGNRALNGGGGMFVEDGFPTITDVRFEGNSANTGGGLYNHTEAGVSNPVLTNVVFKGNSGNAGGAMHNQAAGGVASPVLTNVTFSGNSAVDGGGMHNIAPDSGTSAPTIRNCVFWDNPGGSIVNPDSEASPVTSFSLVEGCNPGESWNGGCGTDGGGNLPDADPLFANGVAGDFRLLPGSPAIFTGNPDLATGVDTDLSGNPRLVDGQIDLGAYQSPGFAVFVSPEEQTAVLGTDYLPIGISLSARDDTGFEVPEDWPIEGGTIFAGYPEAGATVAFDGVTDNPLVLVLDGSGETVTPASTATGDRGTFQINFNSTGAGSSTAQMTNLAVYVVTTAAEGNGDITPAQQEVIEGEDLVLSVTPAADWHLVSVGGDTCTPTDNGDGSWTAAGIAADCHIQANFAINTHSVTASAQGNGDIDPAEQIVEHGAWAEFDVAPGDGWHLVAVEGDSCDPMDNGDGSWVAENITADCHVEASFLINQYTVIAVAGDNGSVTPAEQTVEHGAPATVTIVPDPHYAAVVSGSCPAGNLTGQVYITGPVVEACSVTVEFVSGELVAMPDQVHFQDVVITRMRTLEFNLVNAAGPEAAPVELSGIMLESGGPAFTMDGITCKTGSVLSPGQSCRVQVSFQPMHATPHEGAIRATTVGGQTITIPLSGTVLPDEVYLDRFETSGN